MFDSSQNIPEIPPLQVSKFLCENPNLNQNSEFSENIPLLIDGSTIPILGASALPLVASQVADSSCRGRCYLRCIQQCISECSLYLPKFLFSSVQRGGRLRRSQETGEVQGGRCFPENPSDSTGFFCLVCSAQHGGRIGGRTFLLYSLQSFTVIGLRSNVRASSRLRAEKGGSVPTIVGEGPSPFKSAPMAPVYEGVVPQCPKTLHYQILKRSILKMHLRRQKKTVCK